MPRRLRPATARQASQAQAAIFHLRHARDLLRESGAGPALAKVRRAIKSADGHARHMWRRCPWPETITGKDGRST